MNIVSCACSITLKFDSLPTVHDTKIHCPTVIFQDYIIMLWTYKNFHNLVLFRYFRDLFGMNPAEFMVRKSKQS